jgi:hypothetical protein
MTLPSSGPLTSTQIKNEVLEDPFVMPSGGIYDLTGKTPIVTSPYNGPPWAGITMPNDFWGKTYWRYGSFYGSSRSYITWNNRVYGPPPGVFGIGWTDYTGQLQQPQPSWTAYGQNGYYAKGVISIYGMYPYNQFDITLVGGNYGPHASTSATPDTASLGIGGYADSNGNASVYFNVPNDNFWYPSTVGIHIQRYQLWERDPFGAWITHYRTVDLTRGANEGYDYLGAVTQF